MRSILLLATLVVLSSFHKEKLHPVEVTIRQIMQDQQDAWNRGDIEAFMEPYWHSEELTFIGKSGVTKGWQQTLNNYKKSYPDATAMGALTFDILEVDVLSRKEAYVIGKWHLAREAGDLQGHYTLMWKRIDGNLVIVSDHSS